VAYLDFLFAKRNFGDDVKTGGLVRFRILQILCFEDVLVFFAVVTWSVGDMRMVGLCCGMMPRTCSRAAQAGNASQASHVNMLEMEENN
jgi:hypothetical protein